MILLTSKIRLLIKGFRQQECMKYFDMYSHVSRITSIQTLIDIAMLIDIAAINKIKIHQMNVKTTFLNGDLNEEVHME